MIGTIVGAAAIMVLTACLPQDRAPFLAGLALWGAGFALIATLLSNFAAYAAALAGYTAARLRALSSARPAPRKSGLHACRHPHQRDVHWHRLRGRRSRRN
jgi:uncharacterized membrane protein YccC